MTHTPFSSITDFLSCVFALAAVNHPHNVSSILEAVYSPISQSSRFHSQAAKHGGTLDVVTPPMIQGLVWHD